MGFANIGGTWTSHSLGLKGTFTGFFLIAFQMPPLAGSWYVDLGPGSCLVPSPVAGLCPVTTSEMLLGIPLTKAVVTFTATGRTIQSDNNGED
jgi:hypothetical protein